MRLRQYLHSQLKPFGVQVTRLARGLPMGGDLEYADQNTLSTCFIRKTEYDKNRPVRGDFLFAQNVQHIVQSWGVSVANL